MSRSLSETKEDSDVRAAHKADEPPMFKVLLHNDDYTTMEFVVYVLMLVFRKSVEESTQIMLNVHHKGIGICGIYPFEVAETKVTIVKRLARDHGYPLRCTMEKM